MVLDASLFNSRHYKDGIKGKVEKSWELSNVYNDIVVLNISPLAATPHKTPTVRPPTPYHENYSS